MKKIGIVFLLVALSLLLVPAVLAQATDTGCKVKDVSGAYIGGSPDGSCESDETKMNCVSDCEAPCAIDSVVNKITNLVLVAAGVIAILALIIVGVMFMQAGDPQQKEKLGGRLKGVIIGLVIIVLAKPITAFIFNQIFVAASHCK